MHVVATDKVGDFIICRELHRDIPGICEYERCYSIIFSLFNESKYEGSKIS